MRNWREIVPAQNCLQELFWPKIILIISAKSEMGIVRRKEPFDFNYMVVTVGYLIEPTLLDI